MAQEGKAKISKAYLITRILFFILEIKREIIDTRTNSIGH